MKLISNKERERLFFKVLEERFGSFVRHEHTDSPDFLVYLEKEIIYMRFHILAFGENSICSTLRL